MTIRRTLASAALSCAAAALPGLLAAQAVPAQPERYLLATDAVDARALWVNPAGLARRPEASAGVFATAADSGSELWLSQAGVMLHTRGIAFGWLRDDFGAGTTGNLYVLAAGLGDARLAVGGARRWYRRAAGNDGAWDLALQTAAGPLVDVAVVWRDIGSPQAGDSLLEETLVAGAGASIGGFARVSGEWHAATSGLIGRKLRAALTVAPGRGLALHATADFSPNPRLRGFALAVQLARPRSRWTVSGRAADAADATRELGVSAMSITPPPARRGFPRR